MAGGGATPSTDPSPKGEKAGWRGWAKKAKDKAKAKPAAESAEGEEEEAEATAGALAPLPEAC